MATYNSSSTTFIYNSTQIVWFILGFTEILLALRLLLKLFGADGTAGFTNLIYTVTDVLVSPFVSVFQATSAAGSVFEWTTILAGAICALVAYGIINLFLMSLDVSTPEAAAKLRN
jgi:uncharacterized protein YggT (Ycf19 family)